MEKYTAIKERAIKYKNILQQVLDYRDDWDNRLQKFILDSIDDILSHTDISANVEIEEKFENLDTISVYLGKSESGIAETFGSGTKRNIIKDMGSLNYSQIFNGKVQVWMTFPLIEGLMQPQQPKMIGIYAPPEFNIDLMLSNFDEFFKMLIDWENYDDDQPSQQTNKIGFGVQNSNQES